MVDTPAVPEAATSPVPSMNGAPTQNGSDPDAQEMVITSLRSQIQDLFSQVSQLNGKLVKSYDRVSDLEDDLHMASAQARQSSLKISQLELERTQHLSALNTGLLVEKSHVTAELTRLMEKATDEARQRGQAESAKADIEKDLDDLSATLFAQANTMVAEARYSQAMTERKVEQAETAMKGAEEMVGIMQQQMQTLQAEKDEAERKAREMQVVMGKGKWVDRRSGGSGVLVKETRLLSSHLPYQEFLMFVAHLRTVHPSSTAPPAMTTLLPMAFLARLSSEDS
jgi:chromosome segregation ATPase